MKHRAIDATISKHHALARLGGHAGGASRRFGFGWRNSYLVYPFGQRHTSLPLPPLPPYSPCPTRLAEASGAGRGLGGGWRSASGRGWS
jgi:hypothetical protein